jgi:flavin reductase (DIM6/NTAB) family NADH-FMN oxidoreductase RutF
MIGSEASGPRDTLAALWSPLLAVTTAHAGRANGQIAVAGLSASILPEAPRVLIELWQTNYTHDLILASGVFALHLLPAAPDESLDTSLDLIRVLGFRSGREGDKLSNIAWTPGVTGSPILADALSYVEARMVAMLDGGEMTVFLGDVVAGRRLRAGDPFTWPAARERMNAAWLAEYEASQERQRAAARRLRGFMGAGD